MRFSFGKLQEQGEAEKESSGDRVTLEGVAILLKQGHFHKSEELLDGFILTSEEVPSLEKREVVLLKLLISLKRKQHAKFSRLKREAEALFSHEEARMKLLNLVACEALSRLDFLQAIETLQAMKNLSPYSCIPWLLSALLNMRYIESTNLRREERVSLQREAHSFLEEGLDVSP